MSKQTIIKNNFSSGELSPVLSTRTDIAQYANGAKSLTNVIPLVEGGVRKRPGTLFRHIIQGALRLIPFVSTSENAFLLILKAQQILIYSPKSNEVIATVQTPYLPNAVISLHYVHTRYVMYFTHQEHAVSYLECSEDFQTWIFKPLAFDIPPMDEIIDSPNVGLKPSGKDIGSIISLEASTYEAWIASKPYFVGDKVVDRGGSWEATKDNTNTRPTPLEETWKAIGSGSIDVFNESHVGALISINGGYVRISEIISSSKVMGEVVAELTADIQAIAKSWILKTPAFSAELGYPKCCTYFKQRLILANTRKFPNKVWFSRIGNEANYLETTDDADAFSVVSSSDQSDSITYLVPQKGLIALTSGAEFLIGSEGVLSPTTVQIDEHTAYGAYPNARPCRVGNELLFVQRGGEKLRALSYRFEVDGLVSPEVSAVAGHIGKIHQGIREATYQQTPESLVWLVLGDGKVASITFNREQEVIAWAQQDFGGTVLSMCSVPSELGSDYCYMLIKRNGQEILEEISFDAFSDSERKMIVSSAQVDVTEMDYLNKFTAYQLFDENNQFSVEVQVTNGMAKLSNMFPPFHKVIYMGQPFESLVELFPPELAQTPASSLLDKAKVNTIAFFFNKTHAPKLNGQYLELYNFTETPMDAQKPFSGRFLQQDGDWSDLYNVKLTITHDQPLPFHMQAMAIDISINGR